MDDFLSYRWPLCSLFVQLTFIYSLRSQWTFGTWKLFPRTSSSISSLQSQLEERPRAPHQWQKFLSKYRSHNEHFMHICFVFHLGHSSKYNTGDQNCFSKITVFKKYSKVYKKMRVVTTTPVWSNASHFEYLYSQPVLCRMESARITILSLASFWEKY